MTCITISRQLGSLGSEIAYLVGNRLEFRVVWRDLINQAAIRAGVPEMALDAIDELGLLGVHPSLQDREAYRKAVEQVVLELAGEGRVVILGRAGQLILKGRPDTLHVRLIAPAWLRAQRISEKHRIPLEAAKMQVDVSDRNRKNYLRINYHSKWDDPELYHVILNTGRFTPEAAATLIVQALAQIEAGNL